MPAGRPSLFTNEVAQEICERLAEGESLVSICRDPDMPSLRTAMRWAAENADFGIEYARAREAQAEVMDDKILSTADSHEIDPSDKRARIDAYKWRAAKLAPKRYSDKVLTEHSGPDGRPVELNQSVVVTFIKSGATAS